MVECNFTVGQRVVCINDQVVAAWRTNGARYNGDLSGVRQGAIYTIREVFLCPFHNRALICLEEIDRGIDRDTQHEYGFDPRRFRPVVERKTDISIFTRMLIDKKNMVPA